MDSSQRRAWLVPLAIAGVNQCAMASYHFFLPFHMGWGRFLEGVPASITWALYALNFSWSLLVLLTGFLLLRVATLGPGAGVFARRFVFVAGLFWLVHGAYTWMNPFPMPASLAWLKLLLAAFPVGMVLLLWGPLYAARERA